MSISEYVERYLYERQVEGLSPQSIRLYRFVLSKFADFVDGSSPVEVLDHDLVRDFFFHIYNHGYKPSSLTSFNVVVRIFCKWLMLEGLLDYDPAARIRAAKRPKSLPYYLSDEKVDRLLAACGASWAGIRKRAILLTFLGTGIRLSELTGLTVESVNFENQTISVHGKGNKERVVPFGKTLASMLNHWLSIRMKLDSRLNIDNFFITQKRTAPSGNGVYNLVKKTSKHAGITGVRCTPHTLRHTFATNFISNGGDVVTLQAILGHSSLDMTITYVHLSNQRVREVFEMVDPLHRIRRLSLAK